MVQVRRNQKLLTKYYVKTWLKEKKGNQIDLNEGQSVRGKLGI